LPTLLEELGVDQALANFIARDVQKRSEAFAALDPTTQAVLTVR
jgi:hypothetical protein